MSQPVYLTAAFYKFVDLPDYAERQGALLAFCESRKVEGMILLAREGINSTIAGMPDDVHAVLAYLRADPLLADLQHKESLSEKAPFYRMKVRLKKEIVTMQVPGISPTKMAGTYVKPEDWNALISDPDVVVVDTRNDYEVEIGTFAGAIDPRIKSFAELPAWVEQSELLGRSGKKPKVAMFCTGGIRCEKSTAYMREQGYDEVYHLEGASSNTLKPFPRNKASGKASALCLTSVSRWDMGWFQGRMACAVRAATLWRQVPPIPRCMKPVSAAPAATGTPPTRKRPAHANASANGNWPRLGNRCISAPSCPTRTDAAGMKP